MPVFYLDGQPTAPTTGDTQRERIAELQAALDRARRERDELQGRLNVALRPPVVAESVACADCGAEGPTLPHMSWRGDPYCEACWSDADELTTEPDPEDETTWPGRDDEDQENRGDYERDRRIDDRLTGDA